MRSSRCDTSGYNRAMNQNQIDRFRSKYDEDPGGCYLWNAAITSSGYGSLYWRGKTRMAHRVAWEIEHGQEPPAGLMLDHLCQTKRCVNPAHLEVVTRSENTLRAPHPFNREDKSLCRAKLHEWKAENWLVHRRANGRITLECRLCHNDRARKRAALRKKGGQPR